MRNQVYRQIARERNLGVSNMKTNPGKNESL